MMQDAGADALELNIYFVAADLDMTGGEVEAQYLDLVAAVKQSVSIPLAVKVGPYFSSMGNMAKRLAEAGADGLVLFNRFLQPDIDLETLETSAQAGAEHAVRVAAAAAVDRHPARPRQGLAGRHQRHPRRRRACSRPCWPGPTWA